MKHEMKEIPFAGGSLLGIKTEDGKVWLGVRKVCRDIGLTDAQARAEVTKMQESLLLSNSCKKLSLKFETQVRETLVLSEKFVPMWLAQINLTPAMQEKNPKAVQKLLKYQLEATDVLHKAFYETDEQKSTFHERMGLEGRIEVMTVQINNMENILEEQREDLKTVMESMTLSTRQQQKLYHAAKDRINNLLGGAHSREYKQKSKSYFINLWNGFKEKYYCGSYKDLNPKFFDMAFDFISEWEYTEA